MKNFENGYIETLDRKKIDETIIEKLFQIERDTWAFFMGEYVKCETCNNIDSKEDIYGKIDENFKLKTVSYLEQEYGKNDIKCTCCGGKTEFVRGEEFLSTLKSRIFKSINSFVNVYKSKVDEILGFSYGFIDTPIGLYEKEFCYHFSEKLYKKLIEDFGNNNLITLSGVCITQKEINLKMVYELIKSFVYSVDSKYDNLTGVGEAIIGTPTYKIYSEIGFEPYGIDKSFYINNKGEIPINADIIFLEQSILKSKKILNLKLKEIINR